MGIKIKITLTRDAKLGTDEDMATAVELLNAMGVQPSNKAVVEMECDSQEEADNIAQIFDYTFLSCPDNVEAEIEIKSKRGVQFGVASNTPIEKAINNLRNAAPSAERITLSAGGSAVVIKDTSAA